MEAALSRCWDQELVQVDSMAFQAAPVSVSNLTSDTWHDLGAGHLVVVAWSTPLGREKMSGFFPPDSLALPLE